MAKYCPVTGKKPISGHTVSHANNKTKRRFEPNLHVKRIWVASEKKFIRVRVSARALRIIDKNGVESVLALLKKK